MKLNSVNRDAIQNIRKKGTLVLVTGAILCSLPGCGREVSTNANVKYDVIDTMDEDLVANGIQQRLEVPGEDFDLVVDYRCVLEENAKWTITSDKEMYLDVYTDGLDDNTKVFIDNVHIDTTIRSVYPSVDGITQDTMDDRIHNSQMIGFPISDDNTYSTVNCIEGQNQTFMQGSFYGFNGYSSGSISESALISVRSNLLVNDLNKYGIIKNKTYKTSHLPSIAPEMLPHFMRGLIDGDGSIYKTSFINNNNGIRYYKDVIYFCSYHRSVCEDFKKNIEQLLGRKSKCNIIQENKGKMYRITYTK